MSSHHQNHAAVDKNNTTCFTPLGTTSWHAHCRASASRSAPSLGSRASSQLYASSTTSIVINAVAAACPKTSTLTYPTKHTVTTSSLSPSLLQLSCHFLKIIFSMAICTAQAAVLAAREPFDVHTKRDVVSNALTVIIPDAVPPLVTLLPVPDTDCYDKYFFVLKCE